MSKWHNTRRINGNIRQIIARLIMAGFVIQAEKTKAISSGGKQIVTIGRYRTAVPDPSKGYCIIRYTKQCKSGEETFFNDLGAWYAANWFADFVGLDIAHGAARECMNRHNLDPSRYGVKSTERA